MAQKLLTPFKKLPQQIQNLPFITKLQDLTTGRQTGFPVCHCASVYGIFGHPIALAYDQELCLLAVSYSDGHIAVYGMPGLSFPVDSVIPGVKFMEFIRNEGRLLLATSASLIILELNASSGHWEKKYSVRLSFAPEEAITALAIGNGVVYVGSSFGTLRQVAIENGNMTVGDDDLTSLPCLLVLNKLPEDKRETLKLNTPIVSIELHPDGEELLLGYAGGTAIVAQPQPIPTAAETSLAAAPSTSESTQPDLTEKTAEAETEKKPSTDSEIPSEATQNEDPDSADSAAKSPPPKQQSSQKKSKTSERYLTTGQAIRTQATEKFRTFSRTIKSKIDHDEKYVLPTLPVPPSPRVIRLLPYTQALCCATWRITPAVLAAESAENIPLEVLVAYDDGAYLVWNIPKLESEVDEPVIAVNQDVASVPYGPLPCAPIQRIVARPSVSGGVITAFVGGLPRAQHAEKYTISVLGGFEEHICFQFGSAVCDFVILPSKPRCKCEDSCLNGKEKTEEPVDKERVEVNEVKHSVEPSKPTEVGYLLVLTERELVAIDLTQPSWPVIPSPYLKHLDCTFVTAVAHISLPSQLMSRLKEASNAKGFEHWPVIGGQKNGGSCTTIVQHNEFHDLVAIAHADADVSLWHIVRGDCFEFLGRISTLAMMADSSGVRVEGKIEEEAWPPFRKVGDCACEVPAESSMDARCAIHSLTLKLVNDEVVMLVGGGAGNLSIWSSAGQKSFEPDISKISVDLLDRLKDKFTWEGHAAFQPLEGVFTPCPTSTPAFGLCELIQFNPPSAITAAAYEPGWEALAIGSAHGFALIDLKTHSVVYKLLTHNLLITSEPTVTSVTREAAAIIVTSGRQLKATLRESFRKIRKIRTQTSAPPPTAEATTAKGEELETTASGVVNEALATATSEEVAKVEDVNPSGEEPGISKPTVSIVENEAEPCTLHQLKPTDSKSGVSAVALLDTYVLPGVAASTKDSRSALKPLRTAALIVGTQRGGLITHTIAWAADNTPIEVNPVKEVIFQHGAPIISICALNSKERFSPVTSEKTRSVAEVIPKSPETVKSESGAGVTAEKLAGEGEEPAPKASASAAPPLNVEDVTEGNEVKETSKFGVNHELLICTAAQIRVMSLPSLKTKHKYRFFEKADALLHGKLKPLPARHRGKSELPTADSGTTAPSLEEVAPPASASVALQENAEANGTAVVAPVANTEADSPEQAENQERTTAAPPNSSQKSSSSRQVLSFGLQKLPTESADQSVEWHAVVGLKNGRLNVFTIPGLRRVLKAPYCEHLTSCGGKFMPSGSIMSACVSNSANLVFWPIAGSVLVADEISYALPCRLVSPVIVNGLKLAEGDAAYCVCLPEWARPKPPLVAAPVALASADATNADANVAENGQGEANKENDALETAKGELKAIGDLNEPADTAKQVDDFTKDITKGIIADSSGTVTVKTTESSLEKRTVIEGGNVLTTVHETERVDGEVVKDDIVQVKSDLDDNSALKADAEVTA